MFTTCVIGGQIHVGACIPVRLAARALLVPVAIDKAPVGIMTSCHICTFGSLEVGSRAVAEVAGNESSHYILAALHTRPAWK
jgi:hypothetical protein